MLRTRTEKLTLTSMLLALGIILPFATSHGLGIAGTILLPMHLPVFLCGFLCGPLCGGGLGLILPILNSVLTSMPVLYPMTPIMTFELMAYGAVSGFLYTKTRLGRIRLGVYPTLLLAMLAGKAMYALVFQILLLASGSLKALSVWSAFITGLPGIISQILLIPAIVLSVKQAYRRGRRSAILSAINLIDQDTAACVVIKDNTLVRTEYGRGIGPLLCLYDSGLLKNAVVVDKVIGKASAMILSQGGASECYGITVSKGAVDWMKARHIPFSYRTCVDSITNRTGHGICPMEQTVASIDNSEEGLTALRKKLEELRKMDVK